MNTGSETAPAAGRLSRRRQGTRRYLKSRKPRAGPKPARGFVWKQSAVCKAAERRSAAGYPVLPPDGVGKGDTAGAGEERSFAIFGLYRIIYKNPEKNMERFWQRGACRSLMGHGRRACRAPSVRKACGIDGGFLKTGRKSARFHPHQFFPLPGPSAGPAWS